VYVAVLQVSLIEAENEFVRHSVKKLMIVLSAYLILKAQVFFFVCSLKKIVSFCVFLCFEPCFSFLLVWFQIVISSCGSLDS
jgi:hypothetical protein